MWLLIIFIAIPIIEIGLFIQVGGAIGFWPTIATVILTAFIGTTLLRSQGLATLSNLQNSVGAGQNPMDHIAHGAMILIAGVVLLTPGFFTDAIGLVLLIPPVRTALIKAGAARMAGNIHVGGFDNTPPHDGDRPSNDDIVDADFTVVDEPPQKPGTSGWTKNNPNKE
jgi:UPF0716 protein FxsA